MNRLLIVLAVLVMLFIYNNQRSEKFTSGCSKDFSIWKKSLPSDKLMGCYYITNRYNIYPVPKDGYLKCHTNFMTFTNKGIKHSLSRGQKVNIPSGMQMIKTSKQ
jgi:hypothetical protein